MRLHEWQVGFQQGVLLPQGSHDALLERLCQGAVRKHLQLEIYSNAYVLRLSEALRSNYPAVHQLLGDEDFAAMALQYLEKYPPVHASIRWFGEFLATYLEGYAPYNQLPLLAELARFEWALRHTIDAADAEIVTVDALQAIAPEHWGKLSFALHPSVSVMSFQWNTTQVWQALSSAQPPPVPAQSLMNWIVYRQANLLSGWRSASDVEVAALACVSKAQRFSDICEVVAGQSPDDGGALQSAGLLRSWVEQGLISFRQL